MIPDPLRTWRQAEGLRPSSLPAWPQGRAVEPHRREESAHREYDLQPRLIGRPDSLYLGSPTVAYARASASGSNSSATAQNYYGTPVNLTGAPCDLAQVSPWVSITPLSLSGSAAYSGPGLSGLILQASCQIGVTFWAAGSKITLTSGLDYLVVGQFTQYSRLLPYGYYGGRYNCAMDGTGLVRGDSAGILGTGTPDQVGLMVRVARGTYSVDARIMIAW